jgi:hypothetical protein
MRENRSKSNRTSKYKKPKLKFIWHTIRKDQNAVERMVLVWNTQITRKNKDISYGRGTERRKTVDGYEEFGIGPK